MKWKMRTSGVWMKITRYFINVEKLNKRRRGRGDMNGLDPDFRISGSAHVTVTLAGNFRGWETLEGIRTM